MTRPSHGHGHAHHHHGSGVLGLSLALGLNAAFTGIEAVAGFVTGSLALLADAGHNLFDVVALVVALGAALLMRKPATASRSFGYLRAETLAAFVNALALVVIAIVIAVEALGRLDDPPDVAGGWLIVVAGMGVVINLGSALVLLRDISHDLNVRAAFLHLGGDALGSALVVVTGIVVATTGFELADPIASLVLAVFLLLTARTVLRVSVRVLMEGAPDSLDMDELRAALLAVPGVRSMHDLHVWTIASGFEALSAHVLVGREEDCHLLRRQLEIVLAKRFGIEHTTLQVEHAAEELVQLERTSG